MSWEVACGLLCCWRPADLADQHCHSFNPSSHSFSCCVHTQIPPFRSILGSYSTVWDELQIPDTTVPQKSKSTIHFSFLLSTKTMTIPSYLLDLWKSINISSEAGFSHSFFLQNDGGRSGEYLTPWFGLPSCLLWNPLFHQFNRFLKNRL